MFCTAPLYLLASIPDTFSERKNLGLTAFNMRIYSKNSFPLSSSMPLNAPASLYEWHGGPSTSPSISLSLSKHRVIELTNIALDKLCFRAVSFECFKNRTVILVSDRNIKSCLFKSEIKPTTSTKQADYIYLFTFFPNILVKNPLLSCNCIPCSTCRSRSRSKLFSPTLTSDCALELAD